MSRRLAVIAVLTVAAGGCGSSPTPPRAAEPAAAPPLSERPAGRVIAVGPLAEGLVVDARTRRVAVAVRQPPRLLVLDGRDGRVVRRVPLPAAARHLGLAAPGGPVLVPAEGAGELVEVPLGSGRPVFVRVGRQPHDATASGSRVFVGNELGDTVSAVVRERLVSTLPAPVQPGGVAAIGDDDLGVITVRSDELRIYDPRTGRLRDTIGAGAGPTHIVSGPLRRFYVADTRGDALLIFGLSPKLHVAGRANVPGAPYGIALDPVRGIVWVTETASNRLVGFELRGNRIRPKPRWSFPTVRQPNTVGVDPVSGRVFVAGVSAGQLELIDPAY